MGFSQVLRLSATHQGAVDFLLEFIMGMRKKYHSELSFARASLEVPRGFLGPYGSSGGNRGLITITFTQLSGGRFHLSVSWPCVPVGVVVLVSHIRTRRFG
jgi:hypothetical protein